MALRNRLIICLAGIVAFLVLVYASSPWFLASLVRQNLSEWDLTVTQVRVGYPSWRKVRLHQLQFTITAGGQHFSTHLNDIDISYRLSELVTGRLVGIRVPETKVKIHPAPESTESTQLPTALPLALLMSGQWLSEVPVGEVILEQLSISGRTPADTVYSSRLSGHIRGAEAKVRGDITLPKPKQDQIAFSFFAHKSGDAHLSLSPSAETTAPILEWAVDTVTTKADRLEVEGAILAKPHAVAPVLALWLSDMDWLAQLEGELSGQWQATLPTASTEGDQPLSLKLIKLGGRYKDMAIVGLTADVELMIGERVRTSKDAQLNMDLLEVGFPIEDIAVRFQIAQHPKTHNSILQIKKASAKLLGGRAHGGPFELDFGKDKNRFLVKLEGIGLDDIMRLEQQEDLKGSGVLDGRIPVEITPEGIRVAQGKLHALAPGGHIRYQPTQTVLTLAQTNPSVKMVVDALTDFQYHKLDVSTDYQPGGNLILRVSLKGKNPNWQSGRPVNLNLNLEENIPALLRGLQLSGEITERVRKHYKEKP